MIKKIALYFSLILVAIIVGLIIFWRIAIKVDKNEKIDLGNSIITKMTNYQRHSGLPQNNEWNVLDSLGFVTETSHPEYSRINDDEYEIIFVEGFDGPYLMWNSKEKIWKESEPKFSENK
jgi:hypothetical protein